MGAEASAQDTIIGQVIGGRFKIEKKLAAGGMGVVYKAEQIPLGRPVAVKILRHPQSAAQEESFSKRFLLEAASVANLNHPHTVVIHDYGRDKDLLYFAMEYLAGMTLTGRVRKHGPLHPADAIHVALQIAGSVADAHKQGLVHRDLKPGNIMLTERDGDPNFAKVLDFGLVKMVSQQEVRLTQSGIMLGSPRYMAPEQVRGTDVDHRADIYSFGALLCFALTAKPPFPAGSQFEAMRAHVYSPIPRLAELEPACQAGTRLEQIVRKCLAKSPDERFQSFEELRDALKQAALAPLDDKEDAKSTVMRDSKPNGGAQIPPTSASLLEHAPPAPTPMPGAVRASDVALPPVEPGTPPPGQLQITDIPGASPSGALGWVVKGLLFVAIAVVAAVAAVVIPADEEPEPEQVRVQHDALNMQATMAPVPTMEAATMEPTTERTPVRQEVEITTDPAGAIVRREGADLGDSPVTLGIPQGETWTLTVSADGYEEKDVDVSCDAGSVHIQLVRLEDDDDRPRRPRMREPVVMEETPMMEATPMGMGSAMTDPFHDPWD